MLSLMALPLAGQSTSGTIGGYTLDPAEGQVEEIASVRITFTDLGFWWLADVGVDDCTDITLSSDGGTVYHVVKTEGYMQNYCTMYFGSASETETITSPGTYTLNIPAGVFKQDFSEDTQNDQITAVYTIPALAENSLTTYSLTPAADATVDAIQEILVNFPDAAGTGVSVAADASQITLTADGVIYVCVSALETVPGTVALKFGLTAGGEAMTLSRPGDYVLSVPKNMFVATGTDETNNYRVEATLHVDNPDFDSMARIVSVPGESEIVDSFSSFGLTFPDAVKGLDYPQDISGIRLEVNGEPTDYIAGNLSMSAPYNNVRFSFSASQYGDAVEFTESGTYTVRIPAGVFKESGSELYSNGEIAVTFKVRNPNDPNPFDTYVSVPAEGETVGEIYQISISFTELQEAGIQWPYDISRVTLQRAGDQTVYTGKSTALKNGYEVLTGFGSQENQYDDMLHFRTSGEYTVTIPAGTFVSEADPDVANKEIVLHFTVDPSYNFTCTLSPEPQSVVASLPEIVVSATDVLTSVGLAGGDSLSASLTSEEETIELTAVAMDDCVYFYPEAEPAVGEWTLNVPAGFLTGVTTDGLNIVNAKPVTALYTVKEPQTYSYSTTPDEAADIALFTKYTVHVEGSPKEVKVDAGAGVPMLSGGGVQIELASTVSGADVMFAPKGGATLADGHYTVTVPAGYIVTADPDNLQAAMPAITGTFIITAPTHSGYDSGMLIFNEGWYGHDMASLTHVSAEGDVRYNTFLAENPDKSLGVTGTWAGYFGDRLYAVCKQAGTSLSGAEGGILTQMDAASLTYADAIGSLGSGEQGHAFCGFDATRGYLSTSTGVYPVDLRTMTLGERLSITKQFTLQYGEMLRYRGRVFITSNKWAPVALNPADNTMTELETGPSVKCFVTADGSMYVATLVEGEEFVKVDPATLACERVNLDAGEYTGRTRIADIWTTWTPAPLAVDLTENVVYYATQSYDVTSIARLDLDSGEFTPEFIKLPATETAQTILYGQGISVDPVTGEIVLNAVENGYGAHYKQNFIYRADRATGEIDESKTLKLSEDYWFPSMTVYCGYKAPELSLEAVNLADGPVTIDLREHTVLALGNKNEVEYTLTCPDTGVCGVKKIAPAIYELSATGDGSATVAVTADYYGMVAETTFAVGTTGVATLSADDARRVDVYTTTGVLVLRDADAEAIRTLAPGLYIAGGKKIYVK